MNQTDIISFFDKLAPKWDESLHTNDEIMARILDGAHVSEGVEVLDVACGTGVMFPFYASRQVKSVVGVDISSQMIVCASKKLDQYPFVSLICAAVENVDFDHKFDCIVIYNAFPHFPDPQSLIAHLSSQLKDGGCLCIAHGMSQKEVDSHHLGAAKNVSMGLMPAEELAQMMAPCLNVETIISNSEMYLVSGIK